MGYEIFYQTLNGIKRDAGYGVVAYCDHPGCFNTITRGMDAACCGCHQHTNSCGGFYCAEHNNMDFIAEIELEGMDDNEKAEYLADYGIDLAEIQFDNGFYVYCTHPDPEPKDHPEWAKHVLNDESWKTWRELYPERLKALVESAEHWKQQATAMAGDQS